MAKNISPLMRECDNEIGGTKCAGRAFAPVIPVSEIYSKRCAPVSESQISRDPARADIVRLIPALRAFARTFCRNSSDADDLVQETLMKALGNLDKFEPGTKLKSWLFTIMRNTFYTRAKVLGREAPGLEENVSGDTPIAASQEVAARAKEVQRALQKLPPHYREVLTLVAILGESYESAAEICNCAVGTVKSRLNRARHQILLELGEESENEESHV